MLEFMESKNVIMPQQHGFKRKHCTSHQLYRVTELVSKSLQNRQIIAALFLDISKTFDRVWLEGLLHQLITLGVP
ncbi:putative RNA-directed DNA polymerase from transposon X-element, partial [Stegodyphus mimosarum]